MTERGKYAQEKPEEAFGFRMEYPEPEEVKQFTRELSWDERFEVLSQGFHRGCYVEYCYSMRELTSIVAKRNPKNPTGGVRTLNGEKLEQWLRHVVGDQELADTVRRIFSAGDSMQAIVDTVRVVLVSRMNQYEEVLAETEEA